MHGDDGQLHLSMAQELLIRRLDVPLEFDRPAWLEAASDSTEASSCDREAEFT